MNVNTGFFPPYGCRRKHSTAAYHLPINNQQHHNLSTLPSARSSIESTNGNESFLPLISTTNGNNDSHKPYRRNDFANNHLFIAKRKLARVFLGQPSRNLQATSDLIHLFDQQKPKRKNRNLNQQQRQEDKTSSAEQDAHLSVVDLIMKPPYPATLTRDPLSAIVRNRHSQTINCSAKLHHSSSHANSSSAKPSLPSTILHTYTDDNELDELIDNDNVSDTISTTINPFDSTLLLIDVYQEWAGSTIVLEDIFLKLKRNLTQTEYLTFYSANCENIESLKRYRCYCERLLLFFGVVFFFDSSILNEFIRFMYSGPSTYAVVSKGHTGRSTSDDLHYIIGLNDPDLAKENNPQSLTAIYGTDTILNGFYSSHTNNEALKEIQIVFPEYRQPLIKGKSVDEYVHKTATLCLLGSIHVRSKKGSIIQAIIQHGFEVRYEKTYTFRPDEVESLYIKHRNDEFFKALVEAYTDGPCLLLYVAKENCVADFCEILGPFSREEFSKMPGTLRYDFDEVTIPVTTIHGSESIIDARKELEQFFPYQQTLTVIKPGLTPNQKNDILKRLNLNGFTIMTKETRHLTKDVLTQFYARHQGLPWFNDFIQFMSSDVCEIIILAREDAVQALREIMGPVDPVRAKTDAPESIRAIYGLDIMRNGLHASSNNKHAREEIRLLFPDYEFIKSRPIPFHSNILTTDSVISNDLPIHDENDLYHLESHEIIYELAVHTRTNDNENEESAVFLTLVGKLNETKKCLLQYADNTIHPLQSNQIDLFHFIDQDIGVLKMIKFSHDGRGFPDNWSLANVEVTIPYQNKIFKFDINELINEEKAKIGYPVTDITDIETTTNGNCAIIIQTGSAKYAGTSADCSILLSGSQGVYAFQLHKSLTNRIPFQNRYRDIVLVQVDEQLNDIEYIVLEHNNENSAPAWFVDFVIIKLLLNKQEYFFPVHRWLSIDYFDGKTKITLASDIQKIPSHEIIRYEIYIVTGSMFDAATCSPVWITINGTRGSIINKYLEIAENESFPFEPDNQDLFILYDIDIGEVDKLILGHENSNAEQGWFVQSISIHIPSKQYQSEILKINKWLNSKRIDGVPLVEIQIRKPIKCSPDQMTRWLPRFILVIIDDTQQIFQFNNSKWFPCSNRDNSETSIIQLDAIRTELSNKNSNNSLQSSFEELQNINTKMSNMSIQQIENQLDTIKTLYTNETGNIVIDKRNLDEYNE
ncbi:unnamed protein product [Rotaria sp. Silwood2]|nr:unnamed protein product [Rotaria sp. Silwood2]